MEELFYKWLVHITHATQWRMQPFIIGITGSVGKTGAKDAVMAVLHEFRIRSSPNSVESKWSIPLAILGWNPQKEYALLEHNVQGIAKIRRAFFLLRILVRATIALPFLKKEFYPQVVVLEYGVKKSGDMKELLEIARPHLGIITAIGDIPAHVEFFASPDALMREKAKLVETLSAQSYAILNFDNGLAMQCKERTRAKVMTFGYAEGADIRITNFENKAEHNAPQGSSFKLSYNGSIVPVSLQDVYGKSQSYNAAIAACVGIIFNLHLVKIASALEARYKAPAGTMSVIKGIKDTHIIDDTSHASPLAVEEALQSLRDLPGKRKIAVLGDMLDLGKYTVEAHEDIGRITSKVVDLLVTVGPRAKFIAEAAERGGLAKKKILSFDSSREAGPALQEIIRKGDIVLVKASHAMGFDQVVNELKFATNE